MPDPIILTKPAQPLNEGARAILAFVVVVQFMVMVGYILYLGGKVEQAQLILGAEIAFMSTVLGYYFGSSSGSTSKSMTLENKP